MHADETRLLSRRNHVIGVGHTERSKYMLAKIHLQRLSADGFDRAAGPVEVDAVFPAVARVEHQRQPQGCELARARRRGAADFDIADEICVPGLIAEAGGVGQQMPQRDRPLGRPQPRRAGIVEPLQYLGRRQFRKHIPDRLIQLQPALLDELHSRHRGHRLGHRREPEDAVGRHVGPVHEVPRAERAFVEDPLVGRRHRDDPRHLSGLRGLAQDRVDLRLRLCRRRAPNRRAEGGGGRKSSCGLENFAPAVSPANHLLFLPLTL